MTQNDVFGGISPPKNSRISDFSPTGLSFQPPPVLVEERAFFENFRNFAQVSFAVLARFCRVRRSRSAAPTCNMPARAWGGRKCPLECAKTSQKKVLFGCLDPAQLQGSNVGYFEVRSGHGIHFCDLFRFDLFRPI